MKTSISENETRALTKAIFSWSFLWFIIYCISVVITVGFVSFGIAYFTDYFFHTDIISAIDRLNCGTGSGGITCVAEQLVIKLSTLSALPLVIIPVAIAIMGSLKYDRIRKH
jgi:hypothetical protein